MTRTGGAAEACLWLTPKIFDELRSPRKAIEAFFDHHGTWMADRPVTIVFCASNGDHILNYAGTGRWTDEFDWARYNSFAAAADGAGSSGPDSLVRAHNADWLTRVREGGERSFNPYSAGPMMILSEQSLDYEVLAGIYAAIRAVAAERSVPITLLEYLEPGPEFCRSEWKTIRHPEVAAASADAGGHLVPGVIDVTLPLAADDRAYAAYPDGIAEGTPAGDFVAEQSAAFVRDFALDGVLLGNQFGLVGFWDPAAAPPLDEQRSKGIERFFLAMRRAMGDGVVYWMDTYWRAEVEASAWGMQDSCYATLDAVLVSTFAVLVERTEIVPNLLSKATVRDRIASRQGTPSGTAGSGPRVLFGLDFVDPWYWYRTHLDDRRTYLYQRAVLAEHLDAVDGVSFFANDTFGQFVPRAPLDETLAVLREQGR